MPDEIWIDVDDDAADQRSYCVDNWNDPTKWSHGVPDGLGMHAVFGPALPNAAAAVNLESAVALSVLKYANAHGVTLTGDGLLISPPSPAITLPFESGPAPCRRIHVGY